MEETGSKSHPAPLKHKPSPRHTLEEVLRSLQDMVRNELGESGKRAANAAPESPQAPPGATPGEIEAALQTVLDTLDDKTAAAPDEHGPAAGRVPAGVTEFTLEPSPPLALHDAVPPEPDSAAAEQAAWSAAQRPLPLVDALPELPSVPVEPPAAESFDSTDTLFIDTSPMDGALPDEVPETDWAGLPEDDRFEPAPDADTGGDARETAPEPPPGDDGMSAEVPEESDVQYVDTGASAEQSDGEDVPILEDAVYVPPEEAPAHESAGAAVPSAARAEPAAPLQLEVPLPSPEGAREVAIRTAARLNIELKRDGRRGLSNDVIIRLTKILRDSLAQANANMDNTGPKAKP